MKKIQIINHAEHMGILLYPETTKKVSPAISIAEKRRRILTEYP
jgi:hypothetical protein